MKNPTPETILQSGMVGREPTERCTPADIVYRLAMYTGSERQRFARHNGSQDTTGRRTQRGAGHSGWQYTADTAGGSTQRVKTQRVAIHSGLLREKKIVFRVEHAVLKSVENSPFLNTRVHKRHQFPGT